MMCEGKIYCEIYRDKKYCRECSHVVPGYPCRCVHAVKRCEIGSCMFENRCEYFQNNLAGAISGAYLMRLTRIGGAISERAASLCATKMGDSPLSLFLLAAFCNVMIYIAVEGMNHIGNPTGKYLALIFGVTVFVLCGFEHSIADMYYFAAAGSLTQWRAWACIGIVTVGNAVGGIACHRIRRFVA